MSYRSETIATAIAQMNREYFLPAIQREFVWKPDQIVELFDSIMRGYPISSFLFWDLKPENRDKWHVYKFLDRARQGGTHNELASIDGVTNLKLVLDGQQRLTSLLIGLKGIYEMKKKYRRKGNSDSWSSQRLHLDLLAEPRLESEDAEAGVYYRFEFTDNPPQSADQYWFRLGKILDFNERQAFEDFLDQQDDVLSERGLTRSERRIFERNLDRLYKAIHIDEVIAYYTETDQDYDRVLDIFVRANEGGTKLSKSDLLLSMVISNWEGVNARDEIFNFVEHINTQLAKRNNFDKDFIMKSCLVLTDLPVVYKVENFNNNNLTLIKHNWPEIKSAVERGVNLVNSFGIDRNNLTSVNALIPIIYYLFKNPGANLHGSTPFDDYNSDRIRRWLIVALLKGAFGRASDGLLREIREKIRELPGAGSDFPVDAINSTIESTGLRPEYDDRTVPDVLELNYREQQTFLALSLLYDEAAWGIMQCDVDHIFAQNLFKANDLAARDRLDWLKKKDRLGNLCLLLASENAGKQDMPVDKWLASREPTFLKRHLIPEDKALWAIDRFSDFLEAREALIGQRLKALFAPRPRNSAS